MSINRTSFIQSNMNDKEKEKIHSLLARRLENSKQKINEIKNYDLKEYDVSPMQRHMLEHEEMHEKIGAYNLTSSVIIQGKLDFIALEKAINCLIKSNSSLRTKFVKIANGYRQYIEDEAVLKLEFINISDSNDCERSLDEMITVRSLQKIQLENPPLLRVSVIKLSNEKFVLLFVTHHAIADGWSFSIIIRQLQEYYNSYRKSNSISIFPEKISYIDYMIWKKNKKLTSMEYWIKELTGSKILRLESDWERDIQAVYRGERIYFDVKIELVDSMRRYEKIHKVTMSNIIMSAYQILLSKYTGQKDFIIGMTVAGRENLAVSNMIGCFINVVGMRAVVDYDIRVKDYLDRVQAHFYEMMKHKEMDIYDCLEEIEYEKDNRFSPLFQVMYNYENTPKSEMNFDNLEIDSRDIKVCNALFDLTLSIFDTGEKLTGFMEYKSELFKKNRIEQLIQCLLNVIEIVIREPELVIKNVPLLSLKQELDLLQMNSKREIKDKLFLDRFRQVVLEWGERKAICFEEDYITYKQLDIQSDRMAFLLLNQNEQKSLIGVFMDKSMEAIVAILSILKAGMTYVPIDPEYPEERIQYIINDAKIQTIITHEKIAKSTELQSLGIKNVTYIEDMLKGQTLLEREKKLEIQIYPKDNAYIIYTSGSTGKPKGVMVPHRGLCNVIEEQKLLFGINEKSRILQFASVCFDASIFEMLMALGNGASLYIVNKKKMLGNHLANFIKDKEISHICLTPSVLSLISPIGLEKLETIIVAGEVCPDELVKIWGKKHMFFNAYGPTEATIWTTTARCFSNKKVTIGKPLNNVEVFVLNNQLELVPKGSEGELYIGGIGLCNGYLNHEELNQQKFVQKKFSNGYETTLYASGDMVRWNEYRELEFIGRKDNQVKLRGFRIEIDEIRTKILEYPGIRDTVIGVIKKSGMDVLYAVIKWENEIGDSQKIKYFLQRKLPYYMVPSIISFMEEIPLTWNGKVDTKNIEEQLLCHMQEERKVEEPKTEVQKKLLQIWKEVLGIEDIGTRDNFFEMGGHSLTAAKLVNCINEELKVELTTGIVFNYPTILEMEKRIKKSRIVSNSLVERVERQEKLRLSPQQKQLWFVEQMYPQNGSYNIVMPVRLKGKLKIDILEKSFYQVIKENEILRANFYSEEGIPYQTINQNVQFRLTHYHIMNFDFSQMESLANTIVSTVSKRSFDLERDILVRASLIHLTEEEFILVIVLHHIISDGWSMELFVDELSQTYNHYCRQKEASICNERYQKLQYIDYVYWIEKQEDKWKKQKEFWRETLTPEMDALSIPTDYMRPEIQTHNGYTVEQLLDEEVTLQLKKFCTDKKITTFMFMLMTFSILLYKLTGNKDIPIGVPVAGRANKEMEGMIGFFVNTLVMRCKIASEKTISEYLDMIKNISLLALENQDIPFEDIVQMICHSRDISRSPLIQVMLNVQNPDGIKCYMDGIEAAPYPIIQENTKFDMTLYVEEYCGSMKLRLVYNSDLFKEKRMQEFLRQLNTIVNTVLENKNIKIKEISVRSLAFSQVLRNSMPIVLQKKNDDKFCLDEVVAKNAKKYPNRIAVLDKDKNLTYLELENEAEKLAIALSEKKIHRGSVIIIYGVRNAKLIVSILAILKIGASFSIFDLEYPKERLRKQFEAIHAEGVIVISNEIPEKMEFLCDTLKVSETYEELMESVGTEVTTRENVPKDINDIAYVLFTSGTTGIPNCVCTSHGPVLHFIKWFTEHYGINEDCVFGMLSGLSHDPLIREIFTPLFVGGRLVIQNQESRYDVENCKSWIDEHGINEINITPSLFMMITEGNSVMLPNVRHYFFGGESLGAAHIQRVRRISPNAKCVNFYGSTETPQVMGFYDIPESFDFEKELIPIQGGIDEVRIFIVNEYGYETGVGEPGEICIETPHLSKGYVNNERLNREKFRDSKDKTGWKIYKTGDIGRYQVDGSIVIEGRKDDQMNIRGYRIETKEIEMALLRNDNVRNSVVCSKKINEKEQVVAYLVVNDSEDFEANEMRKFLMDYIPMNVMPERFVLMKSIPLTPNGKIDYRKLPNEFETHRSTGDQPRDEVERKIKKIWSDILNSESFGINENFFDIGGHSLLLAQEKVLLEQEFKIELRIVDLFHYPSIALIGDYIKGKKAGNAEEILQLSKDVKERAKKQYQSFKKFKRIREQENG